MTTTPATFGRFVLAACYGVGVVQVGMLGVMCLVSVGHMMMGERSAPLADWLVGLDVALSLGAVAVMWAQYRRGDLDDVVVRRRR